MDKISLKLDFKICGYPSFDVFGSVSVSLSLSLSLSLYTRIDEFTAMKLLVIEFADIPLLYRL